eukprot:gb/GECG01004827.1/.p1 GENE.gb/GECG01004827.1/~~gb/GECG01004827.1/.p1  ORF type:complete len:537 (+),score=45.62 gb/GECG01004827.1/:1-1611(+)
MVNALLHTVFHVLVGSGYGARPATHGEPLQRESSDLAGQKSSGSSRKPSSPTSGRHQTISPIFLSLLICETFSLLYGRATTRNVDADLDLREIVVRGNESCIVYDSRLQRFEQNCDINWKERGFGNGGCINLKANETFDGKNYTIHLDGMTAFHGLFCVSNEVATLEEAPLIMNVHTSNGATAEEGGFIVLRGQMFFKIDSCSSSGEISGDGSGGIAGYRSGCLDGNVVVRRCHSSGRIRGYCGGGILGRAAGCRGGTANVSSSSSSGELLQASTGGIFGCLAGMEGSAFIARSHSTGDISSKWSGGIVGIASGKWNGFVHISECFTTGDILAVGAGGITGRNTAVKSGTVEIKDSYTTGTVDVGNNAGGICGDRTGRSNGQLFISRVYMLSVAPKQTVMIGDINQHAKSIMVTYSVHSTSSGYTGAQYIVGKWNVAIKWVLSEEGNSGDLDDIRGQLYEASVSNGGNTTVNHRWREDTWFVPGGGDIADRLFPQLRNNPQSVVRRYPHGVKRMKVVHLRVQLPFRMVRTESSAML